jgi:hypothetical protein
MCTWWASPTRARPIPMACHGGWWPPSGPPHLFLHPTSSPTSRKNLHYLLSHVLAPEAEIFDLFAWSSISETVLEDCYLVCDSSVGPISFSSSGLYFEYLAILGAAVDVLAC